MLLTLEDFGPSDLCFIIDRDGPSELSPIDDQDQGIGFLLQVPQQGTAAFSIIQGALEGIFYLIRISKSLEKVHC